jgi:hypothetical protein
VDPALWICPVSLKDMTGRYRFSYISKCGCVLSEEALRNVKSTTCMVCGTDFNPESDIVPINSTLDEELTMLRDRIETKKAIEAAKKSARKTAKVVVVVAAAAKDADLSITALNNHAQDDAVYDKKRKSGGDELDSTESATASTRTAKKQHMGVGSLSAPSISTSPALPIPSAKPAIPHSTAKNINMALPTALLKSIHSGSGLGSSSKSTAIQSLYAKNKSDNETKLGKGNYLTMGTFTRYASY